MDLQMNAIRQLLAANGDYSEDEEFADEFSVNEENAVQQEQIVEAVEEVEQPVETVPSQKSNLKLVYDRHLFVFQKWNIDRTKKFWKCDKYEADGCPKRLHTDVMNRVLSQVSEHNHETNPARIGVHRVEESLRTRATTTVELPSQIISTAVTGQSNFVKGQLPDRFAMKKMVQRARKEIQGPPPTPATRDLYVIPEEYKHYAPEPGTFELFLLGDSNDADRILMFGRSSASTWIHKVRKIYIDGTFHIAPHHFYQIFVIMGERSGFVLPLLYVLLPNKSEACYMKMFEMVKNLWPRFQPTSASLDYEMGLINAVKESFVGISLGGCLFHLSKNMKLHLGNNQLLARYREGGPFTEGARMIVAIAFLRPADVEQALVELDQYFAAADLLALTPILDWFEENYVGHQTRNGRRPALFRNEMWSVHTRTLNGEARTNNHVEAAHRRLQTEIGKDHPTLWTLIDGLKKAQASRDVEYLRMINGEEPPEKRRKYINADRKLLTILENYDETTLLEKLKGIAAVYGMI